MNDPYVPDPHAQTSSTRRRRSPVRRFFGWLLVLFVVLVGLLVLAGTFFQNEITQQVLAAVSKDLKAKPQIREASLSLLSGFPDASVDLRGVRLKDALGGTLLEAENVSFRFALFSLFGSHVRVKSVVLSDGALNLRTDRAGRSSYDIVKETPAGKPKPEAKSDDASGMSIALENAELQDFEVIYDNRQTHQTAAVQVEKAIFAGNFSAKKFAMTSTANLLINLIEMDSSRYLAGEKVSWDAVVAVDLSQDLYDLQGVELRLGGNTFNVDGIIVNKPDFTDYNLKLSSLEGDISMVINLLPDEYYEYFRDFSSTGAYACNGSVKGRLSKDQKPTVAFAVSLRDGKVSSDKLQSPIRDVSFKAQYTARPDGSGQFDILGFRGAFGGQPLAFDLKISDLDDPTVDFRFNGVVPLEAAYGLFDLPEISDGEGLVRINALNVNGKYRDMTSMSRVPNVTAAGEIVFEDAELTYNRVPVAFRSGALRLEDNIFSTEKLSLRVGDSDFQFDGSAKNLLPVLFADSLNTTDAFLEFSAKMTSGNLDVDQILGMFSVTEAPAATTARGVSEAVALDSLKKAKTAGRRSTTDLLKGIFEASVGRFNFKKIDGKNFAGKLAFDHNTLLINGDAEAMGGKIHVEGDHHFELKPFLKLRVVTDNIDLPTCLEQCDNFGQEVIKSENIRGRLSGRVAAWAYWDERGNFLLDKTRALVDVSARDGELNRVKIFEDFSDFIHIQDLRRVRFTQLQNYLEISNKRLLIPAMFIQSNAVNLTLSGTHSFDNDIDYKIKVNAGQVVFNKIKKHDNDLDPLPEREGWFNLFYVIKGTMDKYDMRRSKKTVKADFEKSEARKKNIAEALDAEFRNAQDIAARVRINEGLPGGE